VALQGTLDTFALPEVLRLLAATKKTGRLRITGGRGNGSVWAADGEIRGVEASHAPHATEPVDALFELLRFEEGSFTFDAEAVHDGAGQPAELEVLLADAEALLDEWRSIESIVPSMDAWVSLRKALPQSKVTVSQDQWTTLVAVGAGATVRRVADDLCLGELPVSRAVKELVELGIAEVTASPPAGAVTSAAPAAPALSSAPLLTNEGGEPEPEVEVEPRRSGTTRSRRAKPIAAAPAEPEVFVPIDLPGSGPAPSYDDKAVEDAAPEPLRAAEPEIDLPVEVDDLAAAFPGLSNRHSPPAPEDADLAKQLATLSPRAASAIRAAAEATTDEEREAALDAVDDEDQPLNRGLLLKFLSSVKS
jgi:hypothetical protein